MRTKRAEKFTRPHPMAAPQTFAVLCGALKIPHESTKPKILRFLLDAGVTPPAGSTLPQLKEAAAVAWTRNSLSNGGNPDTWITEVGPAGVDACIRSHQRSRPGIPTPSASLESSASSPPRAQSHIHNLHHCPTLLEPAASSTPPGLRFRRPRLSHHQPARRPLSNIRSPPPRRPPSARLT